MYLGAIVLVPPGWDPDSDMRYPVAYYQGHFHDYFYTPATFREEPMGATWIWPGWACSFWHCSWRHGRACEAAISSTGSYCRQQFCPWTWGFWACRSLWVWQSSARSI